MRKRIIYILGIVVSALRVLDYPPEVTCKVDCATLIGLLEKLASMQSSLGDQCVVVLFGEATGTMQGTCNDADSLELGARVADGILIDGKCLSKELIADLLERCLVCHFTAHHEQPKCQIRTARVHPLVQVIDTLVHEAVEC